MRAQISGLEQASSNVKDGISLVKTGEGAMQEIQDMLNRMVTLATQSANGTYDDSVDRANLQKEVTALTSEIDRISESSNFNGINLLDGTFDKTLQIGDTAASYNQLSVTINSMASADLGIDSIDISTQDGASDAITAIKTAINTVSGTRGDLGAIQNRLEHTSNNLSVMTENIQDAESTIRDTDIAEEMMSYTKNNILVQSAQAMLAQANTVPQGVLQLLQ
jgi:flagellin